MPEELSTRFHQRVVPELETSSDPAEHVAQREVTGALLGRFDERLGDRAVLGSERIRYLAPTP